MIVDVLTRKIDLLKSVHRQVPFSPSTLISRTYNFSFDPTFPHCLSVGHRISFLVSLVFHGIGRGPVESSRTGRNSYMGSLLFLPFLMLQSVGRFTGITSSDSFSVNLLPVVLLNEDTNVSPTSTPHPVFGFED